MRIQTKKIMKRSSPDNLRLSKPVFKLNLSKKNYLNSNWKQAKKRFPGLNPMGDLDFDGTRNKFDCKPFDPARDGRFTDWLKRRFSGERRLGKRVMKEQKRQEYVTKAREGEVERKRVRKLRSEYIKEKYKPLIRIKEKARIPPKLRPLGGRYGVGAIVYGVKKVAGIKTETEKGAKKSVGRPRGEASYKHTHPITGKKIKATDYYKVVKAMRRRAKGVAQRQDIIQEQRLARRGISPEETRAIEMMRLRRIAEMQAQAQMQEQVPEQAQVLPEQVPVATETAPVAQYPSYPTQTMPEQRVRVSTDIMTGRRIIKPIPPRERWTY